MLVMSKKGETLDDTSCGKGGPKETAGGGERGIELEWYRNFRWRIIMMAWEDVWMHHWLSPMEGEHVGATAVCQCSAALPAGRAN